MTILIFLIGLLTVLFLSCAFTMILQEKANVLLDFLLQIAMNNELGIGNKWGYDEATEEWFLKEPEGDENNKN